MQRGRGDPGGGAPPAVLGCPLPCLNSNNCIEPDPEPTTPLLGGPLRSSYALAQNVRLMCEANGLERVGFLTLTFRGCGLASGVERP